MRHRLGLRAVLMSMMAGIEIKGDKAMIQALAEFSKRNASHVKGILNLTIPLSESPVWILGQFLWQMGLSSESRRPVQKNQILSMNIKDKLICASYILIALAG